MLGVAVPFRVVVGVFGDGLKGGFHEGNRDAVVVLAGDAELAIGVVALAVGADDLCDGVHAQTGVVVVARPALLRVEGAAKLDGGFSALHKAGVHLVVFGVDGLHGGRVAAPVGVVEHGKFAVGFLQGFEGADVIEVGHGGFSLGVLSNFARWTCFSREPGNMFNARVGKAHRGSEREGGIIHDGARSGTRERGSEYGEAARSCTAAQADAAQATRGRRG